MGIPSRRHTVPRVKHLRISRHSDSKHACSTECCACRRVRADVPFSWPRFVLGLLSLALLFSDVPRSGVGVASLGPVYPSLQPDETMGFGTSWNYSVFAATKSEALDGRVKARVWSYKFDSTSMVWRAFARFLAVPDFPECFFYRRACPDEFLASEVAFTMIDSLVNAVRSVNQSVKNPGTGPVRLTLRSEKEYIDRLHQFLLPVWFSNINWRTNQALYYSPELLAKRSTQSICFPASTSGARTPRFCQELWINFDRSCAPSDSKGRSVGLLHVHTLQRLRDVQTRYPNFTVDLTLLESQEDMQVNRGGLTSTGFRRSDVSTIIRARQCGSHGEPCETVYAEDYRYETGLLISDIVEWYRAVSALRILGQSYFFFRGVGLLLSCYYIHEGPKSCKKVSICTRSQQALHLFIKVPKQCVVYGSPFPVACYVLAHLLDAPFTYQVLESRFFTQSGVLYLPFHLFISYVVVQMRNVWVYALIWHFMVSFLTSHWTTRNKQMSNGVIGLPGFFLSMLSSITLLAQYRSTTFRSSKILRMMPLPDNFGRAGEAMKYQYSFTHRGRGTVFLGGVIIDLKFLICFVLAVAVAWTGRTLWQEKRPGKQSALRHSHWVVLAPTPVPYSAGALWHPSSICVHWGIRNYCIRDRQLWQLQGHNAKQPRGPWILRLSALNRRVDPFALSPQPVHGATSKYESAPMVHTLVSKRRFIQHQMNCVHGRSAKVETNVAFMNAVLMSDPLVYLNIILGNDHSTQLGYYQSLWRPQHIVLLPVDVVGEHNEFTGGLKLLRQVNASELTWSELVQCG
jgi:hypothetical protein